MIVPNENRTTPIRILRQSPRSVEINHDTGYMVVGNDEAVCFYIDPANRAYIEGSSTSDNDCPVVMLTNGEDDDYLEIEFPEFPGWSFHAGRGGKTISIALVKNPVEDKRQLNLFRHDE